MKKKWMFLLMLTLCSMMATFAIEQQKARSKDGKISIVYELDEGNILIFGFGDNYNNYPVDVNCIVYYIDGSSRKGFFNLSPNARHERITFFQPLSPLTSVGADYLSDWIEIDKTFIYKITITDYTESLY